MKKTKRGHVRVGRGAIPLPLLVAALSTGTCERRSALVERAIVDAGVEDATREPGSWRADGGLGDAADACVSLAFVPQDQSCGRRVAEIEVGCACFMPQGWQCRSVRLEFDAAGQFVGFRAPFPDSASAEGTMYLRCFEDRLRTQQWMCWAGMIYAHRLDVLACLGP